MWTQAPDDTGFKIVDQKDGVNTASNATRPRRESFGMQPPRVVAPSNGVMKRAVWGTATVAVAATILSGCSSAKPEPPPNAGTLIVRVVHTWGPIHADGRPFGQGWIVGTDVRVKGDNGSAVTLISDKHGFARFALAPGNYTVTLPAHYYDDMPVGHGPLYCGVGTSSAHVQVVAHRVVHAQVGCSDP